MGERADRVMKDPAVIEALQRMRQQVYDNIESAAWWNTKELRECRRMLTTIKHFEGQLKKQINEGVKAKSHL